MLPQVLSVSDYARLETSEPNARYRVLELLRTHMPADVSLHPGRTTSAEVFCLGLINQERQRKLLLINKLAATTVVEPPATDGASLTIIDTGSGGGPLRTSVPPPRLARTSACSRRSQTLTRAVIISVGRRWRG